jgi:sigma-E factor negative regulatory protein RseA
MSEKLKESLSAVIDGEADEFELRRVLDEMNRDEVLAASWERYHTIGAVLRGERVGSPVTSRGVSMRERIWAELQAEPDDAEPDKDSNLAMGVAGEEAAVSPGRRRWAPAAVAATVAMAVVVGFMGYSSLDQAASTAKVAVAERTVSAQQQPLYGAVALSNEITASDQDRTEAYIVRHYQQIGMDRPGLGFARMVAYERD